MIFLMGGSVGAADKIRIGVPQQVVHWMVLPLAQKKGLLKEEGFDAEIVRITGPSGRSALVSGEIDYYTTIPICDPGAAGQGHGRLRDMSTFCANVTARIQISSGFEGENRGSRRATRQLAGRHREAVSETFRFES